MDIKELESKTVAQLRDVAKEMGLTGYSSLKKADLVAAISGAPKAPAEAPPEPVAEEAPLETEGEQAEEEAAEAAPEPVEAQAAPEPEAAPEPVEAQAAPEPEAAAQEAPAPQAAAPKPAAPKEPPKPEAVSTKAQVRLRAKYDITVLKLEKRALRSQILAAIADQDYEKMRELRNRKKELRRLLNRV